MLYFLFVQYFYFFISNVVGNIISCSYIAGRQAWRPYKHPEYFAVIDKNFVDKSM